MAANFQIRFATKYAADPLGHHRMLIDDDDAARLRGRLILRSGRARPDVQ
jgi:hypothetical protein